MEKQHELTEWRVRLYEAMLRGKDGKIRAFADKEGVSTEWVRQVLNGQVADYAMLERCVSFLEEWKEQKQAVREAATSAFVRRAAMSPALAY